MFHSEMQVLVAALFSSMLLMQVSSAPHRDMKAERANLVDEKDLIHLLPLQFLPKLMSGRAEQMFPELEDEDEMAVREKVMRRHLPFSQRERKAGCRNFFWKTFTSC